MAVCICVCMWYLEARDSPIKATKKILAPWLHRGMRNRRAYVVRTGACIRLHSHLTVVMCDACRAHNHTMLL